MPEKRLPAGTWVYLKNLAPETTEQDIVEYFGAMGLELTTDGISMRQYFNGSTAVISIPKAAVTTLVQWALQEQALNGKQPVVEPYQSRFDGARQ